MTHANIFCLYCSRRRLPLCLLNTRQQWELLLRFWHQYRFRTMLLRCTSSAAELASRRLGQETMHDTCLNRTVGPPPAPPSLQPVSIHSLGQLPFPFWNTMTLSFDIFPPFFCRWTFTFLCLFLKVFNLGSKTGGLLEHRMKASGIVVVSLTSGSPSSRVGLVTGSRMSRRCQPDQTPCEVHAWAHTHIPAS